MTFGWMNYFNSLVDWIELRNSVSHVHWLSSTIFSCSFVQLSPRIGDIPSSSSVLSFSSPSKLLLSNHETSASVSQTRPATYFPSKFSQDLSFAQLHIGWKMSTGVFRQYWISLYWSEVECIVHKLCMVKYFSLPPYMHHLCSIHVNIIIDHPSAVIVCPPV